MSGAPERPLIAQGQIGMLCTVRVTGRSKIRCVAIAGLVVGSVAGADVEPGEVVTAENHELVRNLLPAEVYALAVEGFPGLRMKIIAPEDYPPHPKYVEATARHACQVGMMPACDDELVWDTVRLEVLRLECSHFKRMIDQLGVPIGFVETETVWFGIDTMH